jgi:chromosome partitioning protein
MFRHNRLDNPTKEPPMPGIIISVTNNKGGVGKTTTTVNLAHVLTRQSQRVLVIDMDSQCNSTNLLLRGRTPNDTLYEVYSEDTPVANCIYPTEYERLFCLANSTNTSALEPHLLQNLPESFQIIRNRVREYVQKHYDFALIDCPPNMGFFVVSALIASDSVIVPVESGSSFSIEGLIHAVRLINEIRDSRNPDLRFLRLLVNKVDRRTAMTKVTIDQLQENFPEDQLFQTMIPINTAFQRAEHELKTITRYDPTTLGAKAYRQLAKELLGILNRESASASTSAKG